MGIELVTLRSTRLSRASTSFTAQSTGNCHFDPQGSREPRPFDPREIVVVWDFDPQGSREPRQVTDAKNTDMERLRSTRLSRASTVNVLDPKKHKTTSIHKALASLDGLSWFKGVITSITSIHKALASLDGGASVGMEMALGLRSTRLSRASTLAAMVELTPYSNFDPQGSREPRLMLPPIASSIDQTSIHKALASLDQLDTITATESGITSIHKALASLDHSWQNHRTQGWKLRSTRLSRASTTVVAHHEALT